MRRGQKRQEEKDAQAVHVDKRACSSSVRPDDDARPSSSSSPASPPPPSENAATTDAAASGDAASAHEDGAGPIEQDDGGAAQEEDAAPIEQDDGGAAQEDGDAPIEQDDGGAAQEDGAAPIEQDGGGGDGAAQGGAGDENGEGHGDEGNGEGHADNDDDDSEDDDDGVDRGMFERLNGLLAAMEAGDPALLLPALTDLCELLCFCEDGYDISSNTLDKLALRLVETAGADFGPEVMLLAVRAMEYLCDATDRAPALLVKNAALPVLVGRLQAIEYLDVAEQCLQAIDKIAFYQPVPCLQAGAAMSCLMFLDFFSTSVQRVAVSAVLNMCWQITLPCSEFIMEAVPTMCNLLQYEDAKIVESAVTCFSKIAQCFRASPDLLDQLCQLGLAARCVDMMPRDGQMVNVLSNHNDLFALLSSLACGSSLAVRTLLELDITGKLRGMMLAQRDTSTTSSGNESSSQVQNVVKLLNQLLPPPVYEDKDAPLIQAKEKLFKDEPGLLNKFAMDIVPASVQIVESGAGLSLCYGIVSIINKLVHFCSSDLLLDAFNGTNISSFLASLLTCRDHHVLIPVLETANNLLQKYPDIFLNQFTREGVLFAIDRLLSLEGTAKSGADANSGTSGHTVLKNPGRCLCHTVNPAQQEGTCKVGKDTAFTLANLIKETHCNSSRNLKVGSAVLNNLKTFCSVLNDNVLKSSAHAYSPEHEEYLSHIIGRIMSEITTSEALSTFEFIESGISKSLINYLCNGWYLDSEIENKVSPDHHLVIQSRIQSFASVIWSERCQHSQEPVVAVLLRKLQGSLSSLDSFPVVPPSTTKLFYASIPFERETSHPCFLALFTKDKEDSVLRDIPSNTVYVESSSTFDAIEEYLWPKISPQETDDNDQPMCIDTLYVPSGDSEAAELEADECKIHCEDLKNGGTIGNDSDISKEVKLQTPTLVEAVKENHAKDKVSSAFSSAKPKLAFYLGGHQLDRSLTLCQAILQQKLRADPFNVISTEFWGMVYKITYKMVETNQGNSLVSCMTGVPANQDHQNLLVHSLSKLPWFSSLLVAKLPCSMEMSNPCYDVLFMLKILEGLNRHAFQFDSCQRKNQIVNSTVVLDNKDPEVMPSFISVTDFLNPKLTGKLEQLMRDPLVLCANMPAWVGQLVVSCPFLFTFTARSKYFRLSISGSLKNQRSSLPERNNATGNHSSQVSTPRKRAKIDRSDIMGSAEEVMKSFSGKKDVLEAEFNEEVGTGLGPTLEFYTLVSHEFQKVGLGLWRGDHCSSSAPLSSGKLPSDSGYVTSPLGLFPRPWSELERNSNEVEFLKIIKKFELFGWIIAKALKDGRILDLPLSKAFYKLILGQELGLYDISSLDRELGATLIEFHSLANGQQLLEGKDSMITDLQFRGTRVEDLCIDFSLPGYPNYILSFNNSETVNGANLGEYISLVVDATVGNGISKQLEAFKSGFDMVFPMKLLQIFSVDELDRMLCGDQDMLAGDFSDKIKFDHGYTASSPPVLDLLEVILEFNHDQQRAFLQFVTGAPRLPPGGLASLDPKLTVVRKHCNGSPDEELPSVMTCANYLKLPPYSSKERMKEKLLYAITEGQGSFHLS